VIDKIQDEYANNVDAGGFTMPLIAKTLRHANAFRQQFGLEENATWDQMAENVLVLRDNDVTLEFTAMNGSGVVKQADVVMVTYPLSYTANYTLQNSLDDLDYVSIQVNYQTNCRSLPDYLVRCQTVCRWPCDDLGYLFHRRERGGAFRVLSLHICSVLVQALYPRTIFPNVGAAVG
jgi:trehalose/maltose hydrolase-like predicted phosphorylase